MVGPSLYLSCGERGSGQPERPAHPDPEQQQLAPDDGPEPQAIAPIPGISPRQTAHLYGEAMVSGGDLSRAGLSAVRAGLPERIDVCQAEGRGDEDDIFMQKSAPNQAHCRHARFVPCLWGALPCQVMAEGNLSSSVHWMEKGALSVFATGRSVCPDMTACLRKVCDRSSMHMLQYVIDGVFF